MNALKLIRRQSVPLPAGPSLNLTGSNFLLVPTPNLKIMKRLIARIALLTLIALATTNAPAALQCYEPYNYTLGTLPTSVSGTPSQTTGGGFSSAYNGGAGSRTTVAGLTYPGLGVNNNALQISGGYIGENVASPISSGTYYISFLMNMPATPTAALSGLEMNTGGNGVFVGITALTNTTQGALGVNQQIGYGDGNALSGSPTTALVYGSTYFVVLKLVGTGSGWTATLWVNPTAGTATEPSSPWASFSVPQFTISACSIVNPGGGNMQFDELRIGTSWADAVDYNISAPSAPTGLAAVPGANSVNLSWVAASGSPASYNVKRSTTSGSGYVTVSTAGAVTGTNYTDNVAGGVTYYYVVSAVNAGGESPNSLEVSATPTLAAPAAPTGLVANASDGQVSLSWAASVAATGYNIKRSTSSGAEVTIASAGTTSFTDLNAANGTTYYYVVSATNSVGEGANSSEVSASPVAYVSVYEPFNYPLGNLTNNTPGTGAGESGNWVIGNPAAMPTIVSPGLTYSGLTTGNNAYHHTATGNQNYINLAPASQLSSGTKYISFLMQSSGNSGGDTVGVYFKGNNATSLFAGFHVPYSADLTGFSLGSVNSTSLGAATTLGSIINISNTVVHLILIRIDFNTSGVNDTVSLWVDPPAGTNSPGAAANSIVSTFDVGTITAFGVNVTGGYAAKVDEFRTGNTYGSVVSAPNPTVVTTVAVSTNLATTVSWTAYSTNVYQVQSSPDNATWSNVGSQIMGGTPNSIVDPANAPDYRVLEYYPVITEVVANGGFDFDTGLTPDTAQNWLSVQSQPPVWINTDGHTAPGCMDLAVTNATATANGSEIQQNTLLQGNPVTPGESYNFSFWAKQIRMVGGYVQQYNVQWLSNSVFLSQSGVTSFTGGSGTWAQITQNGLVAPAGANTALIQILGVTGATAGDAGEVLIDDVSLSNTSLTGGPNILVPAVQKSMTFTATILTNGITAAASTGTVTFKTNSMQLSVNSVVSGVTSSLGTSINPPYTVTAVYSGDGTYLGSTGTLTVGGISPSGPGTITNSVSGSTLTLTWPAGQGWRLVAQTNSLSTGLNPSPSAWFTVPGGTDGSNSIVVDKNNANVFYRLVSP